MRAYILNRYGGPAAAGLGEVARPFPADGEVLVRVRAAGLNPVDYKIRQGTLRVVQRLRLPAVMGNELAGTVEECGPGAMRFAQGERVFARMPKDAMGALAEFAVVPEDLLAPMPAALDFVQAAAIPLAGLTAVQALRDELALQPGARVFIPGGAGGVGTFAIQIAKALGAQVTTTASPRGRELVERLGADEVIDYTATDIAVLAREFDGAFDLIGGETLIKTLGLVKPGRTVVSVAGMPEPQTARQDLDRGFPLTALFWLASWKIRAAARGKGVRYRYLFMHPSGRELAELAAMADKGSLAPVIDRVFAFGETSEALAYLEQGHAKGKVVVEFA